MYFLSNCFILFVLSHMLEVFKYSRVNKLENTKRSYNVRVFIAINVEQYQIFILLRVAYHEIAQLFTFVKWFCNGQ